MSRRVLVVFPRPETLLPFRDILIALARRDDIVLDLMVLSGSIDPGRWGLPRSVTIHAPRIDGPGALVAPGRVVGFLRWTYRANRFDLLVHVSSRIVLLGSLAAWLASARCPVIQVFPGMGYLFTEESLSIRWARRGAVGLLKFLFRRLDARALVQNRADHELLASMIPHQRVTTIAGCGIDTRAFPFSPEPPPDGDGKLRAVLAARMIVHKGIVDLVEAARILRGRAVPLRVVLVGPSYPANPSAVDPSRLRAWHEQGVIEYRGSRDDMARVIASSHIAVLPSYREGLPRFLLEAASCGRPIVASDIPGCRDIVRPMRDGLLVPRGDVAALAGALERLTLDSRLRRRMGRAGRRRAVEAFDSRRISRQYVAFVESAARDQRRPVSFSKR